MLGLLSEGRAKADVAWGGN